MVGIIIVNFNTRKLLQDCLESIFSQKWKYEINVYVVDNASVDGSVEMVKKEFSKVKLLENDANIGFAAGNNTAAKVVDEKYLLYLNSDTIVQNGAIDNLLDFIENSDYGIASCKLLNLDKSLQPNAGDLPIGFALCNWLFGLDDYLLFWREKLPSVHRQYKNYYQGEHEVGWVSGAVMIVRDGVTQKIGLMDDRIFMYGEDVEYCLRAKRAGFKVGWTDKAEIIHLGGGSSKDPKLRQWIGEFRGLLYIYKKYYGIFLMLMIKILIYLSIILRTFAFLLLGKGKSALTYAKVISKI